MQSMPPRKRSEEPPRVTLSTRISQQSAQHLQEIADTEHRSVSQVIAFAVDEYLQKRGYTDKGKPHRGGK